MEDDIMRVALSKLVSQYDLFNVEPEVPVEGVYITVPEAMRPALPLAGYFKYFDSRRVQMLGNAECDFIRTMDDEHKAKIYDEMLSYKSPCYIFTHKNVPDKMFLEMARKHQVNVFLSDRKTSDIMADVFRWLKVELAPSMTVHGVLMDIYGEGVLITGESGIGKSEAALELIKRGHRLVSDDVVELHKVSDATIIGSSPNITRHFIELRGIGIIDVKALYGVECVKNTQQVDMVIKIEDWNKEKHYDRLGIMDHYTEYMGNKIVCHEIPIRPGRNLAIICETAAVNHRQKKMGYNAAKVLNDRVQDMMDRGKFLDGALNADN